MILSPNACGKPRRSVAEGTNSKAVGVGLTNQFGWWQMLDARAWCR